jgi:hypothetical protein
MAGALAPAALGAAAAAIVVVALGFGIHRPLTRVPENALKFVWVSLSSPLASSGSVKDSAWRGPEAIWPCSRSSRAYSCSPICARRAIAGKGDGLGTTLLLCLMPR